MRNFVKVLLVGTVLAGACVLLPNDSWAGKITHVDDVVVGDESTHFWVDSAGKVLTFNMKKGMYEYTGDYFVNVGRIQGLCDKDGNNFRPLYSAGNMSRRKFQNLSGVPVANVSVQAGQEVTDFQSIWNNRTYALKRKNGVEYWESEGETFLSPGDYKSTPLSDLVDTSKGGVGSGYFGTISYDAVVENGIIYQQFEDGRRKKVGYYGLDGNPHMIMGISAPSSLTTPKSPTKPTVDTTTTAEPAVDTTATTKPTVDTTVDTTATAEQKEIEDLITEESFGKSWAEEFKKQVEEADRLKNLLPDSQEKIAREINQARLNDSGTEDITVDEYNQYLNQQGANYANFSSTALTDENAFVLNFDVVFGDGEGPKYDKGSFALDRVLTDASALFGNTKREWGGKWEVSPEQNQRLQNVYGVSLSEDGTVTSSTSLGKNLVDLMSKMSAANEGKGYHSLLSDHADNEAALRQAQDALTAAEAKVNKLAEKHSKDSSNQSLEEKFLESVKERDAAKQEVDKAQGKRDGTKNELDGLLQLARDNYKARMDDALSFANEKLGSFSEAYNTAINGGDYVGAQLTLDKALAAGQITEDEYHQLSDKTTAVAGSDATAKAMEANANATEIPATGPTQADMTDLARIAVLVATPFVTETELALRADVNIQAGDIGASVGTVDDTALSDIETDASMISTASASAQTVANLLKAATVDLKLLDETFEEEEPEPKEEVVVDTAVGSVAAGGSQSGSVRTFKADEENPEPEPTGDEPDPDADDGKKYLTEAQVAEIRARRQLLMRQYVNAAIQISEGMNAVSNKFVDRANNLITFSAGIQNEAAAFGLTQDVGRYVLLESLRSVALSSVQMGVQAARLLNEQEVDDEIK